MEKYLELKNRQSEEFNSLPIFWAFSNKQFEEGMEGFGLNPTDTDKIYKMSGGGYYKRTDSKTIRDMFTRHGKEMSDAIKNDTTGEGFIFDMFDYELSNHEYIITYDVEDTLDACGISHDDLANNPALQNGLSKARKAQWNNQEA